MLIGRSYWAGLLDWMRDTLLANGAIAEGDLSLFHVTDDTDDAIAYIGRTGSRPRSARRSSSPIAGQTTSMRPSTIRSG